MAMRLTGRVEAPCEAVAVPSISFRKFQCVSEDFRGTFKKLPNGSGNYDSFHREIEISQGLRGIRAGEARFSRPISAPMSPMG